MKNTNTMNDLITAKKMTPIKVNSPLGISTGYLLEVVNHNTRLLVKYTKDNNPNNKGGVFSDYIEHVTLNV